MNEQEEEVCQLHQLPAIRLARVLKGFTYPIQFQQPYDYLQARQTPRCVPRNCAGTSPNFALLVVVYERVANTSEWCACIHESRVEVNPPESASLLS